MIKLINKKRWLWSFLSVGFGLVTVSGLITACAKEKEPNSNLTSTKENSELIRQLEFLTKQTKELAEQRSAFEKAINELQTQRKTFEEQTKQNQKERQQQEAVYQAELEKNKNELEQLLKQAEQERLKNDKLGLIPLQENLKQIINNPNNEELQIAFKDKFQKLVIPIILQIVSQVKGGRNGPLADILTQELVKKLTEDILKQFTDEIKKQPDQASKLDPKILDPIIEKQVSWVKEVASKYLADQNKNTTS